MQKSKFSMQLYVADTFEYLIRNFIGLFCALDKTELEHENFWSKPRLNMRLSYIWNFCNNTLPKSLHFCDDGSVSSYSKVACDFM